MEVMELVGRDGSGGDGNRVRSKQRRKVEETDPCWRLLQLCHCCCPGSIVTHVVTWAFGSPGCGSFPGAPMGPPPLLCTPQLQLEEGGDPLAPPYSTGPITFPIKHQTTI